MDFADALAYLDAHINREAVAGDWDDLSIDGPTALMAALGDPHTTYPVVHVTGTNGKGTVVRMVERLLASSGVVAGTYTSPHLQHLTERIARSTEPISEDDLGRVIGDIAAIVDHVSRQQSPALSPSYFELLTAAAFSWFGEVAVEAAVVEVGIFGRFDATNVVNSEVAVVTNVGKDHTDGAPGWAEKVAFEKAGIIKADSAAVIGEVDPALRPIFEAEAAREFFWYGEDFEVMDAAVSIGGRILALRTPAGEVDEVFLPMHGAHQATNAAIALMTAEAFFGRGLEAEVVQEAFAALEHPGRFEIVGREPLIVLDGAHNPPSARALAQTMAEEFSVTGSRIAVVGMIDRDPGEFFDELGIGGFDLVIATAPASGRAVPAAEVAAAASRRGVDTETITTVSEAVDRARIVADELDMVVITGSLYTVGEARTHLQLTGSQEG
jgi:dihydrofolate synthase/folylpolyglutamate synthase